MDARQICESSDYVSIKVKNPDLVDRFKNIVLRSERCFIVDVSSWEKKLELLSVSEFIQHIVPCDADDVSIGYIPIADRLVVHSRFHPQEKILVDTDYGDGTHGYII